MLDNQIPNEEIVKQDKAMCRFRQKCCDGGLLKLLKISIEVENEHHVCYLSFPF